MKPLLLFVLACLVGMFCGGVSSLRAQALGPTSQALGPTGYVPTMYVFQDNKLVDVKTFKIADLAQCRQRASALEQLYLNHSDIEENMSLVVKCVPVPPAAIAHRKGEEAT
jgi:hypothetical protein